MTDFNNLCPIESVFREYDFSCFSRIVDVGGGLGAFTAAALQHAPSLQGHLFDLPHVIKEAKQVRADVALACLLACLHTRLAQQQGPLAGVLAVCFGLCCSWSCCSRARPPCIDQTVHCFCAPAAPSLCPAGVLLTLLSAVHLLTGMAVLGARRWCRACLAAASCRRITHCSNKHKSADIEHCTLFLRTVQAWSSKRKALVPRMSFSGGSFFDAGKVPAACSDSDVFTMRQILHDWSDADSLKILKQVRLLGTN
jgi:hypothetical protein